MTLPLWFSQTPYWQSVQLVISGWVFRGLFFGVCLQNGSNTIYCYVKVEIAPLIGKTCLRNVVFVTKIVSRKTKKKLPAVHPCLV